MCYVSFNFHKGLIFAAIWPISLARFANFQFCQMVSFANAIANFANDHYCLWQILPIVILFQVFTVKSRTVFLNTKICIISLLPCRTVEITTESASFYSVHGPIFLLRYWFRIAGFSNRVQLKEYWSCTSAFPSKIIRHIMYMIKTYFIKIQARNLINKNP